MSARQVTKRIKKLKLRVQDTYTTKAGSEKRSVIFFVHRALSETKADSTVAEVRFEPIDHEVDPSWVRFKTGACFSFAHLRIGVKKATRDLLSVKDELFSLVAFNPCDFGLVDEEGSILFEDKADESTFNYGLSTDLGEIVSSEDLAVLHVLNVYANKHGVIFTEFETTSGKQHFGRLCVAFIKIFDASKLSKLYF